MTQQPPTLTEMLAAKLEPEADYAESRNGPYVQALTSIAISLKRIADQLDGSGGTDRDKTSASVFLEPVGRTKPMTDIDMLIARADALVAKGGDHESGIVRRMSAALTTERALSDRLREANGILEDALQEVGDDYPGSSCQEWCSQQVKAARAALLAAMEDKP